MLDWNVEVSDGVLVWTFPAGMDQNAFGEDAFEEYEQLLDRHDVAAMVTVIELEDPFGTETFEVWETAAERAAAEGIDRWAIVADGLKSISLRSHVDQPGLEVFTTEDRTEAVEWARE